MRIEILKLKICKCYTEESTSFIAIHSFHLARITIPRLTPPNRYFFRRKCIHYHSRSQRQLPCWAILGPEIRNLSAILQLVQLRPENCLHSVLFSLIHWLHLLQESGHNSSTVSFHCTRLCASLLIAPYVDEFDNRFEEI